VIAHIRGGGEEGIAFHRAGVLESKQRSYDDLYAVAEDVARRGIADPARIAVFGRSNGGLMAAVALTQRPELWAAVCSLVPVTDMLRYHLSPYGETGLREYGDPRDPADAEVLRAYSPYHNVRPGVVYPPTLLVAGANDMRCPAWHARKLVARLQAEAEGGPFVLRVTGGGHLSTRRGADLVAELQGFLLRALDIAQPRLDATAASPASTLP
jgi:prolyl oligopeptidase